MATVQKKNPGLKMISVTAGFFSVAVFPYKEDARIFLKDLIRAIKDGQRMGTRSERNLDPTFDGGFDFLILPCKVEIEDEPMIKRGWTL